LGELAEHVGGKVIGDPKVAITSASTLGRAKPDEISFLANARYAGQLHTTKASAVIVDRPITGVSTPLLVAEDPYYAFMQIMVLIHGHREHKKVGISQRAVISDSARVGTNCHIHDFATISDNARIGNGCIIYPCVHVGSNVTVGDDSVIFPNVVVYDGCRIGSRVIINANSSIGQDGFGYATHKEAHHKIPQIGIVVLEDDVEVGSCCGIERGTLGDTVIGEGSKLGDLVTVGHGTKIGPHCLLVAQVGIAGSTVIGHHCIIGGQVGIVGHITIGSRVMVGAQSGVINNVSDGKIVLGSPAIDASQAKRAYSMIQYLPQLRQGLKELEARLDKLSQDVGVNSADSVSR
jgi:UDP-3-O-[3-hydroxymyristoyl] glucosamine N-acyltransferase